MDKQEIHHILRNSPQWHRPDKNFKWWKIAFEEYHKASGVKLSLDCGRCFGKVKEWLEK